MIKLFLSLCLCLNSAVFAAELLDFKTLLSESQLSFQTPTGFSEQALSDNPILSYEKAFKHHSLALEMRVSIRPINRVEIDYEDPHNAAPEPNHLFMMMFTTLIGELSRGGNSPQREYSSEQAKADFNADWAAVTTFDLEPEYSKDYKQGFLLALHKNDAADAYLIFVFNDYKAVKANLKTALISLRYQ